MTHDLCNGRIGVALQETIENKRLCMRKNTRVKKATSYEESYSGSATEPKNPVN